MCNLDDSGRCVRNVAWQLHLLRTWQHVGVLRTRPRGLDHVEEESWLRLLL